VRRVPDWVRQNKLPPAAVPGAVLFARIGCLNCHAYAGDGNVVAGAPDLSREGLKKRGLRWQIRHLDCPGCLVSGSAMPSFTALGPARIRRLAVFLEASRGGH
jgi:mono/diheme cytochrome c family protein